MRHHRGLLALVVALALLGAACGDDDDSGTVASGDDTDTGDDAGGDAAAYTITAAEADGEYAFDIPPDIAGGVVTITLDNAGGTEMHDFQLVELGGGHTVEELLPQLADDETPLAEWLEHGAGVGATGPGSTSSATFELEPNTEYGFFCTESNESGDSHAAQGMAGSFTTGDNSGASLPAATATITATEYEFAVEGLKAGANTIAFTNDGEMLHHVLLIPFAEGKTVEDLMAALESEEEPAEPPVLFEKGIGTAVAGTGDTILYEADLEPGTYAVICFMPDRGTAGPPHAMKGMVDSVEVA